MLITFAIAIPAVIAIIVILVMGLKDAASNTDKTKRHKHKSDEPDLPEVTAYLVCESGRLEGRRYTLTNRLTIGHNPEICNVCYPLRNYGGVAGVHCEVRVNTDGTFEVIDLGSPNGTFLEDGRQLLSNVPQKITNGSRFYLASRDEMYRLEVR